MIIHIPFKTPTINHLYGHTMTGRFYLKKEAKELKEKIKKIVQNTPNHLPKESPLKVSISIHENWHTKKGDVKRKDIANREKFLIDAVFDALEIDDKFIFEHAMKKVEDDDEYAIIKIKELNNEK